ncbi:MAG TPA: VWA domain-containing protein [Candidatus Sulfotelmatobacter sp.]|nr:VWA domain-containing protein [Candidatus Sulfotelmatobacter sp.]
MTESSLSASCLESKLQLQIREHFATWLGVLFVVIAVTNSVRPQEPSPTPSRPGDEYTIRVDVEMVILHATAQDHKHALVSGLDKDNFQVYEDGVLQPIKNFSHEDIPVTVGLVIDNSGSMGPKRTDVIAAALAFARSSNPQDQIFVVNFNERVSFGLPDNTPFTDQVAQLEVALSRIRAQGETALYDALAAALEHLRMGNRDKKVLIIISDGGDNASKHKLTEIVTMVGQPDAIIYTIGIFDEQDPDRNPVMLKRLAKDTGGEAFLPESLRDIAPICEKIAHDIRNQYTISYAPTNRKRDGTYRIIEVRASAPGRGRLSVRTRTGYFAPSAPPSAAAKATDH